MTILFLGRFYVEATPMNLTEKNGVYVKDINTPIWVAHNEDAAKDGARRLNDADRAGALKGWDERGPDGVLRRGWSMDDLIGAARGGNVPREAIQKAGTLIKAIAAIANGKTSFK